jgi:hypothetical protein
VDACKPPQRERQFEHRALFLCLWLHVFLYFYPRSLILLLTYFTSFAYSFCLLYSLNLFSLLTRSVSLAYLFCLSCSFIVLPSLIQTMAIAPTPTIPATAYALRAGVWTAAFLVHVLLRYAWMLYLLARLENAEVAWAR